MNWLRAQCTNLPYHFKSGSKQRLLVLNSVVHFLGSVGNNVYFSFLSLWNCVGIAKKLILYNFKSVVYSYTHSDSCVLMLLCFCVSANVSLSNIHGPGN